MTNRRLDVLEVLKGALVMGLFGGLAVFLLVRVVAGWPTPDAMRAVAVVWGITLAAAAFNGLSGLMPAFAALSNIFAASAGSALGAFLGEYRRVRGVPDQHIIEDIKEGMAAVVDPAVDAALFRTGEGDVVSRYKLNNGLTNIILRYHEGKPISRAKMVAEDVIDQRYWNLAYTVLKSIGLIAEETREFKSKGGLQLDLEFTGRRWRVSMGQEVWVLPEGAEQWQQVDLYGCNFLRRKGQVEVDEGPAS